MNISIRAPIEGSDAVSIFEILSENISIRAPNERSDYRENNKSIIESRFQSALPMKGATRTILDWEWYDEPFQSALPMKGATLLTALQTAGLMISIRAPNEGSDCFVYASADST